jgi:Ni/Co efflux regulator RcnB
MNMKKIACGLLAASMGLGSLAFAQPSRHEDHRDGRGDMRHEDRRDGRDARHEAQRNAREARHEQQRNAREARRDQREARQERREDRREARHYYNARSQEFRRGHRLPPELRHDQYVVSNWRGHHLSAPPRGYHWVQVGPDYVLAAVATGVILNLILSQ